MNTEKPLPPTIDVAEVIERKWYRLENPVMEPMEYWPQKASLVPGGTLYPNPYFILRRVIRQKNDVIITVWDGISKQWARADAGDWEVRSINTNSVTTTVEPYYEHLLKSGVLPEATEEELLQAGLIQGKKFIIPDLGGFNEVNITAPTAEEFEKIPRMFRQEAPSFKKLIEGFESYPDEMGSAIRNNFNWWFKKHQDELAGKTFLKGPASNEGDKISPEQKIRVDRYLDSFFEADLISKVGMESCKEKETFTELFAEIDKWMEIRKNPEKEIEKKPWHEQAKEDFKDNVCVKNPSDVLPKWATELCEDFSWVENVMLFDKERGYYQFHGPSNGVTVLYTDFTDLDISQLHNLERRLVDMLRVETTNNPINPGLIVTLSESIEALKKSIIKKSSINVTTQDLGGEDCSNMPCYEFGDHIDERLSGLGKAKIVEKDDPSWQKEYEDLRAEYLDLQGRFLDQMRQFDDLKKKYHEQSDSKGVVDQGALAERVRIETSASMKQVEQSNLNYISFLIHERGRLAEEMLRSDVPHLLQMYNEMDVMIKRILNLV